MKTISEFSCVTCREHHRKFIKKTCDVCGTETQKSGDEWEPLDGRDNQCEVEVKYSHGWGHSDGGTLSFIHLDVCPACMAETIIPLIDSIRKQRGEPALKMKEVDW